MIKMFLQYLICEHFKDCRIESTSVEQQMVPASGRNKILCTGLISFRFDSIFLASWPQLASKDPYDPAPNVTGQCYGSCDKLGLKPEIQLDASKTCPGDEVRRSPFFISNLFKNGATSSKFDVSLRHNIN